MNTEFDVLQSQRATQHQALAKKLSAHWYTTTKWKDGVPAETTPSINCNQEPCYEELCMQKALGVRPQDRRRAAMLRRREINGGFTPFSPETVRRAVVEACLFMDEHRRPFVSGDTSMMAPVDVLKNVVQQIANDSEVRAMNQGLPNGVRHISAALLEAIGKMQIQD